MTDADDGEDLTVGLKVLPGAGRSTAEDEFEAEGAGVPRLVGERGFLVLGVEGVDGGERDGVVAEEHGVVVAEEVGRDSADGEHRHADHTGGLDAHIGLHCWISCERLSRVRSDRERDSY